MFKIWNGICIPNIIIQNFDSASSFGVSGIPPASKRQQKKAKLIIILVEVPNPLSIICGGTISSTILGVVQSKTPALIPRTNLPKHICQKFKYIAIIDPNRPIILNLIKVDLLPYLMKSPPKIEPSEIPTIVLVVNIVDKISI